MTATGEYPMERFVEEVKGVMAAGLERREAVRRIVPLLQRLLRQEGLLEDKYLTELGDGRRSYVFYREPDGSMSITAPVFLPGRPTPVHDHVTWGVVGVYTGRQRTTRYRRLDDGSVPGRARLELVADEVLTRGDVYPLLPPDDIHRIEALGEEPGISIHVLGMDVRRQRRHTFDPEKGTVHDWEGGSMLR